MKKLRAIANALAAELGEGWIAAEPSRPDEQLGLGSGLLGPKRIVIVDDKCRGVALSRVGGRVEWDVDDGRGIVHSGASRTARDLVCELWNKVTELLADPVEVLLDVLRRESDQRGLAPPEVSVTDGLQHVIWPAGWAHGTLRVRLSMSAPWACISWQTGGVTSAAEPRWWSGPSHWLRQAGVTLLPLKELLPARTMGRRLAYAMIHIVDRRDMPALRSDLDWHWDRRPEMPQALLDAASSRGPGVSVDGWQDRARAEVARLTELLTRSDDIPAKTVLTNAMKREGTNVGLVPGIDDKDGDLPIRTIATLWAAGFGARPMSRILVGTDALKSRCHRAIKLIEEHAIWMGKHAPAPHRGRRTPTVLVDGLLAAAGVPRVVGRGYAGRSAAADRPTPPPAIAERDAPAEGPAAVRVKRRPNPASTGEGDAPAAAAEQPSSADK
ncbi:MAG: hypothetical protein KC620_10240, partial [Myxococcales bacterium]|nr:hypothetical protein [Myxococcales bacterium]